MLCILKWVSALRYNIKMPDLESRKENNFTNGFTLIELLVVISIISLLSTVVMASLNTARAKAQEAAIKSDLQSIKTQAELSYSKVGNYSNVSSEIVPILAHINTNGGTAALSSDNAHYAVSVRFNSDNTKIWSVSDQYSIVIWEKQDETGFKTWSTANSACTIKKGRLPTIEEIKALADIVPVVNFSTVTWSITEDPQDTNNAFSFSRPTVSSTLKTYSMGVARCVK